MLKTVGLVSLGCAKNRVDSEVLLGILKDHGLSATPEADKADVLIVNTCGFIESAKEESIDTIFELAEHKKSGTCKLLVVTGCMAQRYGGELREQIPEIDALIGVNDYDRLMEALHEAELGSRPLYKGEYTHFLDAPRVLTTPSHTAYVKISDGCDNRCSYCAIPLIRGGYRSKPAEDIVKECRALAEKGVTEITLIAQDTSCYGRDIPGSPRLVDLLEQVSAIEQVRWVRVLYTYPDSVDEELLKAMVRLEKVCPYLDIPLQHINPHILKQMNRRGSPEHIRQVIEACKKRGMTLRTTMIVGFPGETEAQFEELLDFVRWARFDRLGAFTYSPEEDTAASVMQGQIDEDVKQARYDRLMRTQQAISLAANQGRVGALETVLVEGRKQGMAYGRSMREAPESDGWVYIKTDEAIKPGTYMQVRIVEAREYDLIGEIP